MRIVVIAFLFVFLGTACGVSGRDADSGPMLDATLRDATLADVAIDAAGRDGGAEDARAVVDAPALGDGGAAVGAVRGECGVLDDEILATSPSFFRTSFDFGTSGWTIAEADRLTAGAQEILAEGTAGGSSGYSEAFAFEALARCEGATLVKSETEIVYDVAGTLTDMLVRIDGELVGVSVTRAVTVTGPCMRADTYAASIATDLLTNKLGDILVSSANVSDEDRWVKQILLVFADTAIGADAVRAAWDALDPSLRADTIVHVSVSEGDDGVHLLRGSLLRSSTERHSRRSSRRRRKR